MMFSSMHIYDRYKLLVPLVVPRFDGLYAVKYYLLYNSTIGVVLYSFCC
jgi:hypothetical protein